MIECLEIDRDHPRSDRVHAIARLLSRGGLVACPTDTTYGLFAAIEQRAAVARLKRLRARFHGRDEAALRDKPLAMIFADVSMLADYVVMSGMAFTVVKRLLPGPYTVILPANRTLPKRLQSKRRHVGARIPDDALVQAIVREHGQPILSTTLKSAEGELLGDAVTISHAWSHDIDVVIDSGSFAPEVSTVLAVDGGVVDVIREGKGPVASL